MAKIALIGAGSVEFTKRLVNDILFFDSLKDAHIALMDIDDKRLALTYKVMENMKDQHGLACTFTATSDRREALKRADFAISVIMAGGMAAYEADINIPLRYGVDQCVGDTLNPGGIFRGLRHIPALVEMMKDVEEVCPDVLFLNHSNPMPICCWAIQKSYPDVRFVGLCHGTQHTTELLCRWLGVDSRECEVLAAGINHMAWFLKFEHEGQDLYPRIWERLDREGPVMFEQFRFEMMKATGYFMTETSGHLSEYVPYFRRREDLMALFGGPWLAGETAGYLKYTLNKAEYDDQLMSAMASGEMPVPYEEGKKSVEFTADIMNARLTGTPFRFAGNVLNKSFITNLPFDCCVEVTVFVDRDGFHPTHIGDLPPVCAALCRSNVSVHELAVRAALEGDYEAAYHACLMDPLTAAVLAPHEIRNMVDEMFEAQMEWLPQFKGRKNTYPGATVGRLENGVKDVKVGANVYAELMVEGLYE